MQDGVPCSRKSTCFNWNEKMLELYSGLANGTTESINGYGSTFKKNVHYSTSYSSSSWLYYLSSDIIIFVPGAGEVDPKTFVCNCIPV